MTKGGVHVLINNAGIIRDKTFAKMDPADFELVVRVHLFGAAFATKACWETMREQNYGRVLMVSSSTGLGGNFGQSNYAAAKMGMIGLAFPARAATVPMPLTSDASPVRSFRCAGRSSVHAETRQPE
jgi:NAD(P)-dependent dehydrogenase (short-subunit alcohol dehydrogenase family)